MPKIRSTPASNCHWLRQRELGIRFPLGHADQFHKNLYSSIKPVTSWDHTDNLSAATHGGVFNLEYSPDGSLLLAACEKKSILMFDPLRRRLVHAIDNAHNDCVNCVRFLDQRMFATCSDDSTVALWDARNLKQRIRTLQGHSNWVKNIEYSPRDSLLLTSGFDGSIYTWDINSFTENSILYTRVFHTNGLMRTRLSPDASKMLISTTSGYLIIIHNLELSTLNHDLAGFKPNMYRLMQSSQTTIANVVSFTHLFSHSRTRNRVEFLTDFPAGDDAEIISSLQVHPQGWCALSRNVSNGEKSEWTCVHDIQERDLSSVVDQIKDGEESGNQISEMNIEEFEVFPQPQPSRMGRTSPFVTESSNAARDGQLDILAMPRHLQASSFPPTEPPLAIGVLPESRLEAPANSFPSTDSSQSSRSLPESRLERRLRRRRMLRLFPQPRRPEERALLRTGRNRFMDGGEANENTDDESGDRDRDGDQGYRRGPGEGYRPRPYVPIREREAGQEHRRRAYISLRDPEAAQDYRSPRYIPIRDPEIIDNYSAGNIELPSSTIDVWEAHVAMWQARRERELSSSLLTERNRASHTVVIIGDTARVQGQNRQGQETMYAIPRNHKIHQNVPRLTHYIEEPNVGSGYIKELCFSADGRLICSPFGYGVRLLAFSNDCSELSDCVPPANKSVQLHELATNVSHSGIVVSTKFSPRHCLLVSGCLSGKIVWHQPVV